MPLLIFMRSRIFILLHFEMSQEKWNNLSQHLLLYDSISESDSSNSFSHSTKNEKFRKSKRPHFRLIPWTLCGVDLSLWRWTPCKTAGHRHLRRTVRRLCRSCETRVSFPCIFLQLVGIRLKTDKNCYFLHFQLCRFLEWRTILWTFGYWVVSEGVHSHRDGKVVQVI